MTNNHAFIQTKKRPYNKGLIRELIIKTKKNIH
jgi:hypothetical protein